MNPIPKAAGSSGRPPESLVQQLVARSKRITRASLVFLKPQAAPFSEIFLGQAALEGEVVDFRDGIDRPLACSLQRVGDDPPRFRLTIKQLPECWEVLNVSVGKFSHWQFPPVGASFSLGEQPMPPPAPDMPTDALEFQSLAADTMEDEPQRISAESADLSFEYTPDEGLLAITARLPRWSDGETVVAELRSAGRTLRRAVRLDYRLRDGRTKANIGCFFPDARHGQVELLVRPMTDGELGLLEPEAVEALLAEHDFQPMPCERSGQDLLFSARWLAQQTLAADRISCWALSVVKQAED